MSMSKKDYIAIARAISVTTRDYQSLPDHVQRDEQAMMADLAWTIADYCQSQSSAFDRARFLAACGVSE